MTEGRIRYRCFYLTFDLTVMHCMAVYGKEKYHFSKSFEIRRNTSFSIRIIFVIKLLSSAT